MENWVISKENKHVYMFVIKDLNGDYRTLSGRKIWNYEDVLFTFTTVKKESGDYFNGSWEPLTTDNVYEFLNHEQNISDWGVLWYNHDRNVLKLREPIQLDTIKVLYLYDAVIPAGVPYYESGEVGLAKKIYFTSFSFTIKRENIKTNQIESIIIDECWKISSYDFVAKSCEGFTRIILNNKTNFKDENDNFLFNEWLDGAKNFHEGFAAIKLNGKWNFINKNKRFLSEQWFDDVKDFENGFAIVKLNNKWNFIDTEGNFLLVQWFDDCHRFCKEGIAIVKHNEKYNFINRNGKLVCDFWFDDYYDLIDGFVSIKCDGKWNNVDIEGKLFSKVWFDSCWFFNNGIAVVELNGKKCHLKKNGTFLENVWFDRCENFTNDFAQVSVDGKDNYINIKGNLLSDIWFDFGDTCFHQGFVSVYVNGCGYYMNTKGRIIEKSSIKSCEQLKDFGKK